MKKFLIATEKYHLEFYGYQGMMFFVNRDRTGQDSWTNIPENAARLNTKGEAERVIKDVFENDSTYFVYEYESR